MTREAVLLGTRVFSVFPAAGFLDRKLMEMGLIERLDVRTAGSLTVQGRRERKVRRFNPNLREELLEEIIDYLEYEFLLR